VPGRVSVPAILVLVFMPRAVVTVNDRVLTWVAMLAVMVTGADAGTLVSRR